jgi:hypothetical protein
MKNNTGQLVVAIGENIGFDHNFLPYGSLDRETAAVDLGLYVFDNDAAVALFDDRWW